MADLLDDADPAAQFLQEEGDQLRELGIDESQFNVSQPSLESDDMGGLMGDFSSELAQPASIDTPVVNGYVEQSAPVEEPESLKKWREERAIALEKQEEDEQEAKQALQEKAKKELEDWYNHYHEQLEKVKTDNRLAQEQFIEEATDKNSTGNLWEKVAKFCDFNPKFTKNTKDVSRMRGLLLQLKQKPVERQ